MKRIILSALSLLFCSSINAQILNSDLESWSETDPTDWIYDFPGFGPGAGTNNWVEFFAEGDPTTTNKISGAGAAGGAGNSAVLETKDMIGSTIIGFGINQLDGLLVGQFPLSGNPTDFSFDFNVMPATGDTGIVWLTLYDVDTVEVGYAGMMWIDTEATSAWTPMTIPVTYTGTNTITMAEIYCSSSYSLDGSVVTGSILYVDNFVLGGIVGVNELDFNATIYPNPAKDVLHVELENMAESISIIGMDGTLISNTVVNSTTITLEIANLTSGIYFYEITSKEGKGIRDTFVKE